MLPAIKKPYQEYNQCTDKLPPNNTDIFKVLDKYIIIMKNLKI